MYVKILFRKACLKDLKEVMQLIKSSIDTMEKNNIYHWNEFYPIEEDFIEDIKNNCMEVGIVDEKIAVICAVNGSCQEVCRKDLLKLHCFFLSYIHICNYLTCNFILLSNCHITSFFIFFLTSSVGFNATLSGTDQFLIPFLNLNGFSALAVSYTLILFFIISSLFPLCLLLGVR